MSGYETKDSGERVEYESGMHRDVDAGKARFDLTEPKGVPYTEQLSTRFAELLGRGADKYGDRNWELANSQAELDRFKGSAYRHFKQWFHGETDEDHAAAVIFNLTATETLKFKLAAQQRRCDGCEEEVEGYGERDPAEESGGEHPIVFEQLRDTIPFDALVKLPHVHTNVHGVEKCVKRRAGEQCDTIYHDDIGAAALRYAQDVRAGRTLDRLA